MDPKSLAVNPKSLVRIGAEASVAGENWVVKSNQLVQARFSHSLMVSRLLMMAVEQIGMHDTQFQEVRAHLGEYARLTGSKAKNLNQLAQDLSDDLLKVYVEFPITAAGVVDGWERITVFTKARYRKGRGYLVLKINDDLAPHLLQLKEEFTRYRLGSVFGVSTPTAIRIYELCKQYERLGSRTISVLDLRLMFQMEDVYPRYSDFKRWVLEKAKEEINEKTDLRIGYDEIRVGRSVQAIRFKIKRNTAPQYDLFAQQKKEQKPPTPGRTPRTEMDETAFDRWWDELPEEEKNALRTRAEAAVAEREGQLSPMAKLGLVMEWLNRYHREEVLGNQ